MSDKPRLLILSFSPIASDARVLKQVNRFVGEYEVTTCGYGEAPAGVDNHLQIPDDVLANDLYGRYITARLYRLAYWRIGAVRWCRQQLKAGQWDVILANDVEAVPVAVEIKPRFGVHADLHEYTPRMHDDNPLWDRRIRPFWEFVCHRWVAKADSWSTVSGGLAAEYERVFGFTSTLVTNAAPYADYSPEEVLAPIRLVHSGAGLRNRSLMLMIEAVAATTSDVTLDLYLMQNDPRYLEELRTRAKEVGRVTVHDPVPYADLVSTLHGYDLGVIVVPPKNFSYLWGLPNKLFDFVQARLGMIVGPSPEMVHYVETYGLGAVAEDFSVEGLTRLFDELTPEKVAGYKAAADASAHELSSEEQVELWARAIEALIARRAT